MKLPIGERCGLVDFRRDPDQGVLIAAHGKMPIHCVVAKIGGAAREPARERRPAVVEHLVEGSLPVDQMRLLRPERIAMLDRTAVEIGLAFRHGLPLLSCRVLFRRS